MMQNLILFGCSVLRQVLTYLQLQLYMTSILIKFNYFPLTSKANFYGQQMLSMQNLQNILGTVKVATP